MKRKSTIVVILFFVIFLTIFNFIVVQTDILQSRLGIHLNSTPVLVANKTLYPNDIITEKDVELVYMPNSFVLKPVESQNTAYILSHVGQLKDSGNGAYLYSVKERIVAGEQIPVSRLESAFAAKDSRNLMQGISVSAETCGNNLLYRGDSAFLYYKEVVNGQLEIKSFFKDAAGNPQKITITQMQDGEGNEINANRSQPRMIPSTIIVKMTQKETEEYARLLNNKAVFYFVVEY